MEVEAIYDVDDVVADRLILMTRNLLVPGERECFIFSYQQQKSTGCPLFPNTIKSMQSFIEMKGSISLDGVGRTRLRYRYEYMLKIVVWYYGSRSEQSTRIHIYRIYIR